ncbi:MBG domain-containing protein [[Eubacterium] hominis]|uniref:MBG domain-containing protein n=1 Tax=[Eubacterium] hominis TaxID=2764325 RepID=UPI003A4DAA55
MVYLDCSGTSISNLDVSSNTALKDLFCNSDETLKTLNVNGASALESLDCAGTSISNLDISSNTALITLYCNDNENLKTLNVKGASALQWLNCSNIGISNLNVSSNTDLKDLFCNDNENLKTLNVKGASALESLNCSRTGISGLNVSENKKLAFLYCTNINFAYLDLGINIGFTNLDMLTSVTRDLAVADNSFHIEDKFDGIDKSKITIISGADYDSENGIVSNYTEGTPIVYEYKCGTVKDEEITLTVTLNIKVGIEINEQNFPDEGFRDWLKEQRYGKDGIITQEEIANITRIDVTGEETISNLTGIANFTKLKELFCSNNENLKTLNVKGVSALVSLDCSGTSISNLDVSSNTALTTLLCKNNEDLKTLNVKGASALTTLYCDSTNINSLDVSSNTALTNLYCNDNENLKTLNVKGASVLELLNCSGTSISNLDVSSNTALTTLLCKNNGSLKTLNVKGASALTTLYCDSTNINSLDVSSNTALTTLFCNDNESLKTLNVKGASALESLICSGTSISNLDVSSNTALTTLICNDNENLKTLNVKGASALQMLLCSDTGISGLSVSENKELISLNCKDISFAYLDLGTNIGITDLSMPTSVIKDLAVAGNSFHIVDKFDGIDKSKVTIISGADYDSENGIVSNYIEGTPIVYEYKCGTVEDKEITLTVTLNFKTGIEINEQNFPDEGFREWLKKQDYGTDGIITQEEIANITRINVAGEETISDLTGIANFTKLKELYCGNNENLKTLNVEGASALVYLDCSGTSISNLDVSSNTALTTLICKRNESLKTLNVKGASALVYLDCSGTSISNLDISGNIALTDLICSHNESLKTLNVKGASALQSLNCSDTGISGLNVSENKKLAFLYCTNISFAYLDLGTNIGITDLNMLRSVTKDLAVAGNSFHIEDKFDGIDKSKITIISGADYDSEAGIVSNYTEGTPIVYEYKCGIVKDKEITLRVTLNIKVGIEINEQNFPDEGFRDWLKEQDYGKDGIITQEEIANITRINVAGEKTISDLAGIEKFTNLEELDCIDTSISSLDVSNNTKLEVLSCYSNAKLKTLEVNGASSLVYLNCNNTSITSLDVSSNANLVNLNCSNNENLKTLKVNGAIALTNLNCYGTGITSLDVSDNANLKFLNCNNTPLANLNLGTNTSLIELYIPTNVMLDLDVTENTFKIEDKIKGIDKSKITIQSGASLDSETGIVSGYKYGIPIVYEYDCGIAKGKKQSLTVTLYLSGYSTSLELNEANFPDIAFRKYLKENTIINPNGDDMLSAAEIANVKIIDITGEKDITNLTGIAKFTNMTLMYCDNTSIESLDVSSNEKLEKLVCANNKNLKNLNVSGATNLSALYCFDTNITSLDVSNNTNLIYLDCHNTPLAYLNLGDNPGLLTLSMPTSVTIDLKKVDDTFNIGDKFAGIDLSKITIKSGAKYDSKTGIVSGYTAETPIVYEYDCGTADNVNRKLTVTLNIMFKEDSSIDITENLDKTYDEKPVNETPEVTTSGSTGAVTYAWEKQTSDSKWESIKEAPMNAGTYRVTATVASDDNHKSASTTNVFTISKAESTISITETLDKTFNGKVVDEKPEVTTKGSTGVVTYAWEKQISDSKWESINEAPTNAGTYRVTATVASDDNYKEASSTAKEFTISKAESTISIIEILDKTYDGSNANKKPSVSVIGSLGEVTYTWEKQTSDSKWESINEAPINAGTYRVTATVASDDNCMKASSTAKEFTISKAESTISIIETLDKIFNGKVVDEKPEVTTKGSSGAVTYTWEKQISDSKWESINEAPTNAGTYRVTATVASDDNYKEASSTAKEFTISKAESTISITETLDKTFNGKAVDEKPEAITKGSTGEVTYTWEKKISDSKWESINEAPTDAGTYRVTATIASDDNYKSASTTNVFTISQAENSWMKELDIKDWTYGKSPVKPSATSKYGTVSFTYSDSKTGVFKSDVPENAGTWYVKASVSETDSYKGLEEVKAFQIEKAEAPTIVLPQNLSGVYHKELSSVKLPEGWKWADGTLELTDASTSYQAYVKVDDENYDYSKVSGYHKDGHYVECSLSVTLSKAENRWIKEPSIKDWTYKEDASKPSAKAEYGDVVYTYSNDPNGVYTTEVPTTAGTWYMKATIIASKEYTGLDTIVTFEILQAEPTYTIPTGLEATFGESLKDVELPTGFTWAEPNEMVGSVGSHEVIITYTPQDTNYKVVTGIKVKLNVHKADNKLIVSLSMNDWVYGETPSKAQVGFLFGTPRYLYSDRIDGAYTDVIPTNAGTWYVKAVVEDSEDYEGIESEVISFVIEPKSEVKVPTIDTDKDLEDIRLTDGEKVLVEGIDYDITTEIDGDKTTVIITMKGNYTGTIIKTYTKQRSDEGVIKDTGGIAVNGFRAILMAMLAGIATMWKGKKKEE